jgi:transcriptional regulator with XRE-family HTH domain
VQFVSERSAPTQEVDVKTKCRIINMELKRRQKMWTQAQLGVVTRISPSFISQIETRAATPNDDQLQRIARALDLDPAMLLQDVPDLTKGIRDDDAASSLR